MRQILAACALALTACTGAQLDQVRTTLPTAIAGQSVAVRAIGGPADLAEQQKRVRAAKGTDERREAVQAYRTKRAHRLAVTRATVEGIAAAAEQLSTDLLAVEADLLRNDAQIDAQIEALGTEGHPVTPSTPAPAAPSAPPAPPPPAPAVETPPIVAPAPAPPTS